MDNKPNTIPPSECVMMSLFDYLGRSAGSELGKQVYKSTLNEQGITTINVGTRNVATAKYTGKIMLYPKWYLNKYFAKVLIMTYVTPHKYRSSES